MLTAVLCLTLSTFWSDEGNGHEVIEKRCGDIERNEFDYNEGCETTKIPFKNKVCYCKTSLCNGSSTFNVAFSSLNLAMALIFAYFLKIISWNLMSSRTYTMTYLRWSDRYLDISFYHNESSSTYFNFENES